MQPEFLEDVSDFSGIKEASLGRSDGTRVSVLEVEAVCPHSHTRAVGSLHT